MFPPYAMGAASHVARRGGIGEHLNLS